MNLNQAPFRIRISVHWSSWEHQDWISRLREPTRPQEPSFEPSLSH
jgi:hypothetical protein